MEFVKYPSLTDSKKSKTLAYIRGMPEVVGDNWVVTEKLHGANFSLWCDGTEAKAAKRSGFIGEDENFFGSREVQEKYKEKVKEVQEALSKTFEREVTVVIYGELFGGGESTKPVQREIKYNNGKLDFCAFDLVIDGVIQDHITALGTCKAFDIPFVKTLFAGSFDDALAFDPNIESKYSDDGKTEGVTLKPNKAAFFGNGSRVMLKNRTDEFMERKSGGKYKKTKEGMELLPQSQGLVEFMKDYICFNRVSNVASHDGITEFKDFGKLLGKVVEDIFDECVEYTELNPRDQEDFKKIKREISNACVPEVRAFLESRSE